MEDVPVAYELAEYPPVDPIVRRSEVDEKGDGRLSFCPAGSNCADEVPLAQVCAASRVEGILPAVKALPAVSPEFRHYVSLQELDDRGGDDERPVLLDCRGLRELLVEADKPAVQVFVG